MVSARRAVVQQLAGQGPVNIADRHITSHVSTIGPTTFLLHFDAGSRPRIPPALHRSHHNNLLMVVRFEIETSI